MRTYRFRIYPSDAQTDMLDTAMELCRQLYNATLERRIYAYRSGRRVNYDSQQDELPELKNAFPEYRSIHSQVLQDVARSMGDAGWNRIVQYTMYKAESAGAFTVMSMLQ
ncbi:MAG: helix-turn-helix domain-containing protein [Candidatus Thermoplasmatota archaeon]|nr:helix-turn-helix domain-containing protein [Candidatus Thermoplasmatota archaeon]